MSSSILHDPTFPHGTPDGFREGCAGSACPAPVPCRAVHMRYNGDYGFRKRIDAGEPAVDIIEAEKATAAAVKRAEAAAERAARLRVKKVKKPKPATSPRVWFPYGELRAMHAAGLTDTDMMSRLGKSRQSVGDARRKLGLPANTPRPVLIADQYPVLHAEGLTDQQIAVRLGAHPQYINKVRRDHGLKPNPAKRTSTRKALA